MYGLFQDGRLTASEPLRAGLDQTSRSIAALHSSATAKKYSMRLKVADAQTAEILSDLFGQPPLGDTSSEEPSPALAATQTQTDVPAGPDPVAPTEPSTPVPETPPASSRLADIFWHRRSLAFRVVVWLVSCLVAAVLIVVPVAIMALFPNHLTEIAAAYAFIGLLWWLWRRRQLGTEGGNRSVSDREAGRVATDASASLTDDLSARGRAGCAGEAA